MKLSVFSSILKTGAGIILATALTTGCSGGIIDTLLGGPKLVKISIDTVTSSVPKGTGVKFTAWGLYTDNKARDISAKVTWTSSNTNSVVINTTGVAQTIKVGGPITITATLGDVSDTSQITVQALDLVSIEIVPGIKTIKNGLTLQYKAIGLFSDNSTVDLTEQAGATWSHDTGTYATVDAAGLLSTVSAGGTETISFEYDYDSSTTIEANETDTASVTVSDADLLSIAITPSSSSALTFADGTSKQLTATGYFSDNTSIDMTNDVTWSTGTAGIIDDAVIVASDTKGLANATNSGTTTVTISFDHDGDGGVTTPEIEYDTVTLTVTNATLSTIQVTPESTIAYGTNQQFTAIGTFSDGSTQDITDQVTWDSQNDSVAEIFPGGMATSKTNGTSIISAIATWPEPDITGNATMTVEIIALESITITPPSTSLRVGQTTSFTATGTYTGGVVQDLTEQVTWSSSASSDLEISNVDGQRGAATALGENSALTVTASRDGVSGTSAVNISAADTNTIPPELYSVTVLGARKIKVKYSKDVNAEAAADITNYALATSTVIDTETCTGNANFTNASGSPAHTILSISVLSLSEYVLNLDTDLGGGVEYYIVADISADANQITDFADPANVLACGTDDGGNAVSFLAEDNYPPYMVSVINPKGTEIIVKYNEPMTTGDGPEAANNLSAYKLYAVSPYEDVSDKIESVTVVSGSNDRAFKITLNNGVDSINYKIQNTTAQDLFGNTITTPNYLTFIGNEDMKVVSAESGTDDFTVIVTFNKPVHSDFATISDTDCETYFKIIPNSTDEINNITGAVRGTGDTTNTITLTHDKAQKGTVYNVIVANGVTGDGFNNAANEAIYSLKDDVDDKTDTVQAQPKDRAPFVGSGEVHDEISDGDFFTDPFSDATSFSFAFTYGGRVYLGPNDTNENAFRFDADGLNSVLVTFAFSGPYFDGTTTWPPVNENATGFGNNDSGGYYGEDGIVGFTSVTVDPSGSNPLEMLLVGTLDLGGVGYFYYTQDVDTQLDWIPYGFVGTGGGNTKSIQTIYGTGEYIYVAAASPHGQQKPVVSVYTVSETGGVISIDDASDLALRSADYIGNTAAAEVVGIDSMISYNGYLYMANNGGIVYSSDYTGFSGEQSSIPSGFTGTTLQLPSEPNGGLEKLTPGQRGIPFLVEYNGLLYMGRNVSDGTPNDSQYDSVDHGELWVCDPDSVTDEDVGGPNDICEPGEWTLLIRGDETELPAVNAISLLQPNGSDVMYVGFDSASGVQIFRINDTEPDPTGVQDLADAGWALQGTTGLNNGYTIIYSSASINFESSDYFYVTVGKDSGTAEEKAIRVLRQLD